MAQDVPNMRAHVESRGQWPLWLLVALFALGAIASYLFSGPSNRFVEPVRRSSMLLAAELFAEGQADAALSVIDSDHLKNAPEGAFLRAIILYYRGSEEKSEAIAASLEEAAGADIPGADTMLGWVLLADPDCASCAKRAAHWFEHALTGRPDRDARLGLAAALTVFTRELSMPRAHYDALLSEGIVDVVRIKALTLRGSVEPGTEAATAYTEAAARQGFAEAQFRLWKRYLADADVEAKQWLAMAALQGHEEATEQIAISRDPPLTELGERRLLAMADDLRTAIGRAARWCETQAGRDEAWLRSCRLGALEGHLACVLPDSVIDTLGLRDFEQSKAYSLCRLELIR